MSNAGPSKLSFGLKPAKVALSGAAKPNIAPSALAFDDASDEDEGDGSAGLTLPSESRRKAKEKRPNFHGVAPPTRTEKKKQQEAEQLDASVFDYDGVYNTIKDAERRVKQAKQAKDETKKPKYVDGILESAEQRKRDRLRAEARMIQKQRQAEGDEFADKESFVTNSYKEQQEELAKAEEQQNKEETEQRKANKGMGSFYRDMLNETNAARDAAISASLAAPTPSTWSSTSQSQVNNAPEERESRERTDIDLANEARSKGLEVELNDDNQIVDKRSLLSTGLNIISKRRKTTYDTKANSTEGESRESRRERDQRRQEEYEARMNRDAHRSKRSALIEEQMLELERKRAAEEEEALRKEKEKVDAKRNDTEAISQAKQRYLERKKQRLAAAGQGSSSS